MYSKCHVSTESHKSLSQYKLSIISINSRSIDWLAMLVEKMELCIPRRGSWSRCLQTPAKIHWSPLLDWIYKGSVGMDKFPALPWPEQLASRRLAEPTVLDSLKLSRSLITVWFTLSEFRWTTEQPKRHCRVCWRICLLPLHLSWIQENTISKQISGSYGRASFFISKVKLIPNDHEAVLDALMAKLEGAQYICTYLLAV